MKKIVLILFLGFVLSGCTNIRKLSLSEIVDIGVKREIEMHSESRVGYNYYIPRGMKNIDYTEYNEKLSDSTYTYYLYIDAISYLNKVIESYEINNSAYYSEAINYEDKFGYIEIKNVEDDKYLVEIMYNYAKIEVIVKERDIPVVVLNSLTVLSSVVYNDTVLNNLMGDNVLQFKETEFNIFEPKEDSGYLYHKEKDDEKESGEQEVHDPDLIN